MINNIEDAPFAKCLKKFRPRDDKFPRKLLLSDEELFMYYQGDRTAVAPGTHGHVQTFFANIKNALQQNQLDERTTRVAKTACNVLEEKIKAYKNQSYYYNQIYQDHSAERNI